MQSNYDYKMHFKNLGFRKIYYAVFIVVLSLFHVSCKQNDPVESSAYISDVYEYVYAPGQHASSARESDISNFIGDPADNDGWLYLGGFGGYVVAGFDHDVQNADGNDFEVYPYGPSPEPAVVFVMADENGDGKPNDKWYELKGNQFENSKRNYSVTYFKAKSETENITWKDDQGNSGELISTFGSIYSSGWWWPFTANDSITFTGTRLPDAYVFNNVTLQWVVPDGLFEWGYAENNKGTDYNSTKKSNEFDISNAVDSLGNAVQLTSIRFIKVQSAVLQQAGQLNEVSSEITGAKDLKK